MKWLSGQQIIVFAISVKVAQLDLDDARSHTQLCVIMIGCLHMVATVNGNKEYRCHQIFVVYPLLLLFGSHKAGILT